MTDRITTPQIQCGITRTTPATHDVIRANVHRSPMYSGQIRSTGPRYCEIALAFFRAADMALDGIAGTKAGRTLVSSGFPQRTDMRASIGFSSLGLIEGMLSYSITSSARPRTLTSIDRAAFRFITVSNLVAT